MAINNHSYPTLRSHTTTQPPAAIDEILFVIATIFVRNHEIVVVGISGSCVLAVEQQGESLHNNEQVDFAVSSGPDIIGVEQQGEISDDDMTGSAEAQQLNIPFDKDLDCSGVRADRITAVINLREEDRDMFPTDHYCILVNRGKSLLEDGWKGDMWQRFHAQR
jgi:hypothetical protein